MPGVAISEIENRNQVVGDFAQKLYYLVSIRKHRMRHWQFPIRKGGIFRSGKESKGLRGGVHGYAAQGSPKIDTARAEKNPF
jgi:hypothetical protein